MASAVVLPMSSEVKNPVSEHSTSTLLELQLRSAKQPFTIFLLITPASPLDGMFSFDKKYYARPIKMFTINSSSLQEPGRLLSSESKLYKTITDNLKGL